MLIKINIKKKHPTVTGAPTIICGNSGYKIQFTFDDEWAKMEFKTARFVYRKAGKIQYIDVPFSGNIVDVPVFSEIDSVLVGVYTDLLQTTTPTRIPCEYSIRCNSGENFEEITPEIYEQMMALFNQVVKEQDTAAEAAQTATAANEEAQEAAKIAKEAIGGVVSKVVESNAGRYVSFWVGTREQYNAIGEKAQNCMYIITDDTTSEELLKAVSSVDISDKISLTLSEEEESSKVGTFYLEAKKYIYNPSLGVVFFELSYLFDGTGLQAGDVVRLKHTGGYVPQSAGSYHLALANTYTDYSQVTYGGRGTSPFIDITMKQDRAIIADNVAGWYFCKGE